MQTLPVQEGNTNQMTTTICWRLDQPEAFSAWHELAPNSEWEKLAPNAALTQCQCLVPISEGKWIARKNQPATCKLCLHKKGTPTK